MADRIITVTDPSVVTNDTLAGYNNYSDIDGQLGTTMTPTEATNGHTVSLSDGVVHEVTTKPVGTTNGEFSAVISNAVTVDLAGGANILLQDDFTGTVIDTTKWNVLLTNTSGITAITQDDVLSLRVTTPDTGGGTDDNTIFTQNSYPVGTELVVGFDLTQLDSNGSGMANWGIIISEFKGKDDPNAAWGTGSYRLGNSDTVQKMKVLSRVDGTVGTNVEVSIHPVTPTTLKMKVTPTNFTLHIWDGVDTWTLLDTTANATTSPYYIGMFNQADQALGSPDFDNLTIVNEDYTTQYPADFTP